MGTKHFELQHKHCEVFFLKRIDADLTQSQSPASQVPMVQLTTAKTHSELETPVPDGHGWATMKSHGSTMRTDSVPLMAGAEHHNGEELSQKMDVLQSLITQMSQKLEALTGAHV